MKPLIIPKILLIVLVILSCSNNITDSVLGQRIFFEVEHINHAWGYMHWGIYIGDSGEIYSYQYDPSVKREDRWKTNQNGVYSEQELFEKFDHHKQFVIELDKDELIQMVSLISSASRGSLSEPDSRMDDAGLWKYKAYTYDNLAQEYKEIILRVEGDWFAENKSWQARVIAAWLETQKAYWLESRK